MLKEAIKITEKAGKLILKESKKSFKIDEKSLNDYVTSVDKAAEKLIIAEIEKKYPHHSILAEESFHKLKDPQSIYNAPYIWIIDPIDGTLNFTRGLPIYGVSIGIYQIKKLKSSKNYEFYEGELTAGVVHVPVLSETFSAEKGKGAFLNGKPIHVSDNKNMKKAVFATGFPPVNKESNLPYFETITKNAACIRRLGAASVDLAYVAAGRLDGFWEFGLKPWDIAAGALILAESGGRVTDTNGAELDLFGGDILATNGHIHKKTIELFAPLSQKQLDF